MQMIAATRTTRPTASIVGSTLFGSASVAFGLGLAYMTLATPLAVRIAPPMSTSSSSTGIVMGIWAFSLVAGGALVVAGTDRLALVVAGIRQGRWTTPVLRVLRELPGDVVVAIGVVPDGGRPIPELVIGQFGAAVVHEHEADPGRQMQAGLHAGDRDRDGWGAEARGDRRTVLDQRTGDRRTDVDQRTGDRRTVVDLPARADHQTAAADRRTAEESFVRLTRDAERVRRWLGQADLDFVVRVHAALVTPDTTITRTPACAVISEKEIPAWLAALPRQRSLTVGRRARIVGIVRDAVDLERRREPRRTDGMGRGGKGW